MSYFFGLEADHTHNAARLFLLILVQATLHKRLRLRRFKPDRDKIW